MRIGLPNMAAVAVAMALLQGCSASPAPESAPPPPSALPAPNPETGYTGIIVGGADSVGAMPGSESALYVYRFRQVDPGSERFTHQDRDLSFYFRPSPSALYIQVENRTDLPVWIEWERSTFLGPDGRQDKIATAETTWDQRFSTQAPSQIAGLQRYSNYLFPVGLLLDPAGSDQQLHRPLFPENNAAPQYADREFGVDLMFRISDRMQPYRFRFRVVSVMPR